MGRFVASLCIFLLSLFLLLAGCLQQQPDTANQLIDTIQPQIILSTYSYTVSSSTLSLQGTASDNVALSSVKVRVAGGAWQAATGSSSWQFSTTVSPSTTVEMQSYDIAGNPSNIISLQVPAHSSSGGGTSTSDGPNIVVNGNFESGTSQWTFFTDATGSFNVISDAQAGSQVGRVTVTTAGTNIQLYERNLPLEPNTRYRVSFSAYSPASRQIGLVLHKHGSPYTLYGLDRTFSLTNSWQTYSYEFSTTGFTSNVNDGRLRFKFNGLAQAGDLYYIDEVKLVKVGSVTAPGPQLSLSSYSVAISPYAVSLSGSATGAAAVNSRLNSGSYQPTTLSNGNFQATHNLPAQANTVEIQGQDSLGTPSNTLSLAINQPTTIPVFPGGLNPTGLNVISNAGFESGTANWVFFTDGQGAFSSVNDAGRGSNVAKIAISQPGTNVQLYQQGLSLYPNTRYRLTFSAYSNSGSNVALALQKHGTPYTGYGLPDTEFELTPQWQTFNYEFTTSGFSLPVNDGRLRVWLSPFDAAGDEFYFDDVFLANISSPPVGGGDSTPPTLSVMHSIVPQGGLSLISLTATATDSSGVDSIFLSLNGTQLSGSCGPAGVQSMTCTYSSGPYADNTVVSYFATARDSSPAQNTARYPGTGSVTVNIGGGSPGPDASPPFVTVNAVQLTQTSGGGGIGPDQGNLTTYSSANIQSVWALDDTDTVKQDDLAHPLKTTYANNRAWNGNKVSIFGGKNEILGFQLQLESSNAGASNVDVEFTSLTNGQYTIQNDPISAGDPYDYRGKRIELFRVQYVNITSRSTADYLGWNASRALPDSKYTGLVAEPLVPFETAPGKGGAPFSIGPRLNQGVWIDVYVPKDAPAGLYTGKIKVKVGGTVTHEIPVQLRVYGFTIPDEMHFKNFFFGSGQNLEVKHRVTFNRNDVNYRLLEQRYMQLARRHNVNINMVVKPSEMTSYFGNYMNGNYYTPQYKYDGPHVGAPTNLYMIGMYDFKANPTSWTGTDPNSGLLSGFVPDNQAGWRAGSDAWVNWFSQNSPQTEYYAYLYDEPAAGDSAWGQGTPWTEILYTYPLMQQRVNWTRSNPGPGQQLKFYANMHTDPRMMPYIDHFAMTAQACYMPATVPDPNFANYILGGSPNYCFLRENAARTAGKKVGIYDQNRPSHGGVELADTALIDSRALSWVSWKYKVDSYMVWLSMTWNPPSRPVHDIYVDVKDFGGQGHSNEFYPGEQKDIGANQFNDKNLFGPVASVRLKSYRRGTNDYEYMWLARQRGLNPDSVVNGVVERAFNDYGPLASGGSYTGQGNQPPWGKPGYVYEDARKALAVLLDPTPLGNGSSNNTTTTNHATFTAIASDESGISSLKIFVNGQQVSATCTPSGLTSTCTYVGGPYASGTTVNYFANATDASSNANSGRDPAGPATKSFVAGVSSEGADLTPPNLAVSHVLASPTPPSQVSCTHYVSTTGSDLNTGTSLLLPWRTITKANAVLAPGQTVCIRAGTYHENIQPSLSGTIGNRITYAAYPGEEVIVDGASSTQSAVVGIGYNPVTGSDLSPKSYITIDGITIKYQYQAEHTGTSDRVLFVAIFNPNSEYNEIKNCKIIGIGDSYANYVAGQRHAAIAINGAKFTTIENCQISGTNMGVWIMGRGAQYTTIRNNVISNTGQSGIDIQSPNVAGQNYLQGNLVENNIIEGSQIEDGIQFENEYYSGDVSTLCTNRGTIIRNNIIRNNRENAIDLKGAANIVIENNIIYGTDGDNDGAFGGNDALGGMSVMRGHYNGSILTCSKDVIIRNNVIYDGSGGALVDKADGYRVFNNNMLGNNRDYTGSNGATLRYGMLGFTGNDLVIKNNIVGGHNKADLALNVFGYGVSGFALNNNLYPTGAKFLDNGGGNTNTINFAAWKTRVQSRFSGAEAASIEAAPLFTNAPALPVGDHAQFNFDLQSSSPAVNAGAFLTSAAAAGSGTTLVVQDAKYFTDGFGITSGDMVQVGSNAPVRITAINYATNTLTLASSISWAANAPVSLAYAGTAPDIGARELGVTAPVIGPISTATFTPPSQIRNNLLFTLDAENGLTGMYRSGTGNPMPWMRTECTGSGFPIKGGNCAYVYNLSRYESPIKPLVSGNPYSGNSSYRTMGALRSSQNLPWVDSGVAQTPYNIVMGKDYWFGMSIYLPSNWVNEIPNYDTIIYQTQAYPDNVGTEAGLYRSPVFSIEVDSDHWQIKTKYDNRSISPASNTFSGSTKTNIGPIAGDKGRWVDFVWKIKYGYNNTGAGSGSLKMWKDGVVVLDKPEVGIGSNDVLGPYPSMGIYNWQWSPANLVNFAGPFNREKLDLYIDEYRMGSENATYNDVAPAASSNPPPAGGNTAIYTATATDPSGISSLNIIVNGQVVASPSCTSTATSRTCTVSGGPYSAGQAITYFATATDASNNLNSVRDPAGTGVKSFTTSGGQPPPSGSTSSLWGVNGELWSQDSRLPDYSYAGYREGAVPLPNVAQVKNVRTDYGATGNGVTDDTAAFQNALASMPAGALYIPDGTYLLSDRLVVSRSNIVLRGQSKEGTILKFTQSFSDLNASGLLTPTFRAWMYGQGGLLWMGKLRGSDTFGAQLATVSGSASRGDKTITLSSTSGITAGQYIVLEFNPTDLSFKRYLYGPVTSDKVKASPSGTVYRWPVKVDSKSGNTITLHQPLRTDIRPEWGVQVHTYTPVTEVGLENVRFQFPNIAYTPHHQEPGFNAFAFWGCLNCWAKNIDVYASDDAIDVNYLSKHVTLQNIRILGRTTPNGANLYGHHGFSFNINAADNLLTDFSFDKDYHHDIDLTHFVNGNVIRNGQGPSMTMGHHMDAPFENLWSNLSLGNPRWDGLDNPYGSSGGEGEAHSASWNTYWNIKSNSGAIECPQSYRDTYWNHNYSNDFPSSITVPALTSRNSQWCFGETITGTLTPVDLYQSQLNLRLGINPPPTDTTPPTVAFTSPVNGATLSDTATLLATASDDVGVVGVQFKVDGANFGAEDTTSPYSALWNTATYSDGPHTLSATARDAAGNSQTDSILVIANNAANNTTDSTAPTVSITSPANGATVNRSITVAATASDNVGVVGVQFKLDGANLGNEDLSSPYTTSWNTSLSTDGTHILSAVARDAAGNNGIAPAVLVTVDNPISPPPDTTQPNVSFTAPLPGAVLSNTVQVSAVAADNVGVVGIQYRIDGTPFGGEDTSPPYGFSWDTTLIANGAHTLSATARDAAGNSRTTPGLGVTISNLFAPNDTLSPNLSIGHLPASPASSQQVTFTATASDESGIALLALFVNNQSVSPTCSSTATTRSCAYLAGPFAAGSTITYYATSRDSSSNQNFVRTPASGTASFTVQPASAPGILSNPGFEQGTVSWTYFTNGVGNFGTQFDPSAGSQAGAVSIIAPGTNVQLYQNGVTLRPATLYRLSFAARASRNMALDVSAHQDVPPYASYGMSAVPFALSPSMQTYSTEFVTPVWQGPVTDARLRFWFASYSQSGDQYYLDDVILESLGTVAQNDTTAPNVSVSHFPLSPNSLQIVTYTANAVDASGVASISLVVNGAARSTNCTSTSTSRTCVFVGGPYLTGQNVTYSATATDASPNANVGRDPPQAGSHKNFIVGAPPEPPDNTAPTVSISNTPPLVVAGQNVTITATASDSNGIYEIRTVIAGVERAGSCLSSPNVRTCTYIGGPYSAGQNISYSMNATDNSSSRNTNFSSGYFVVGQQPVIDVTQPQVVALNPPEGEITTSRNIRFLWTATDDISASMTCDLYVDSSSMVSGVLVASGIPYRTQPISLEIGEHRWQVICIDRANNTGESGQVPFIVRRALSGNGSTIHSTGFGNLRVLVNGTEPANDTNLSGELPVHIVDGDELVLQFNYDFASQLDLSTLSMQRVTEGDVSLTTVSGVNSNGGLVGTKVIRMQGVTPTYNAVCVKNAESVSPDDITSGCTGLNELIVPCDGSLVQGVSCEIDGTTLTISGLQYSGIRQFNYTPPPPPPVCGNNIVEGTEQCDGTAITCSAGLICSSCQCVTSGGNNGSGGSGSGGGGSGSSGGGSSGGGAGAGSGGSSGGGAGAGGGGAVSATFQYSKDVQVEVGRNLSCNVNIRRGATLSDNSSTVTTILVNKGSSECNMYDFVFSDSLPSQFPPVSQVEFSLTPLAVQDSTVAFQFPIFAWGESKVLTYTVQSRLPSTILDKFNVFAFSTRKAGEAPSESFAIPVPRVDGVGPTAPVPPGEQPAPYQPPTFDALGLLVLLGLVLSALVYVQLHYHILGPRKPKGPQAGNPQDADEKLATGHTEEPAKQPLDINERKALGHHDHAPPKDDDELRATGHKEAGALESGEDEKIAIGELPSAAPMSEDGMAGRMAIGEAPPSESTDEEAPRQPVL